MDTGSHLETQNHPEPIVVSASRRTDIPAFYGDWFQSRLREGFCEYRNPFGGQTYRVSLQKEHVLCFVFWSKNYRPFLPVLENLHDRGFPFYCHFTINGYPKELEHRVPPVERLLETAGRIADRFGQERIQWRYDPIILSSKTPESFHLDNFSFLADRLRSVTGRCYFSFLQYYHKVKRKFRLLENEHQVGFQNPTAEEKRDLVSKLFPIAAESGIEMFSCCDDACVIEGSVRKARCVDRDLVERAVGSSLPDLKPNGTRETCGCFLSRDIGEYDTCLHDCRYCYAVSNHSTALEKSRLSDPASSFLVPPSL